MPQIHENQKSSYFFFYEKTNNRRSLKFWYKHPNNMPIDCTKCQICGVYRKKVIWEFAGGKSKFAHAFFETLKKFFLEAPRRKPPTCGTKTFFLSLLIRLRLSMAVFRISISVIVFVLLKVRINAPKKYPRINAPPYAILTC